MRGRLRRLVLAAGLALGVPAPALAQTVDALYAEGVEARRSQRFEDAIGLFERALALDPDNADALVQLGLSHLALDDRPSARDAFEAALDAAPDYADARYGLAQIAFRDGDLDEAERLLEPLIEEAPGRADFVELRASIAEARRAAGAAAPAPAARAARAAPPAASPSRLEALSAEGRRLRIAGRFAEAETIYRQALAIAPDDVDTLVALGLVSGFQQKFPEAQGFFDRALVIAPGSLDARLGLVRLALWQGEIGIARERIRALEIDAPANGEVRLLSARVALVSGDAAAAESQFAALVAEDASDVEAVVGLGDARRARGDDAAAREAYRGALVLSPGNAEIEQRLAAPAPKRWRLDAGTEVSALSGGRGTWTDSSLALTYAWSDATTLSGRTRLATRFGDTDLQVEGRLDHALTPGLRVYGLLAATPEADFLARFSAGGGVSARVAEGGGAVGPLYLNLDGRYDVFAAAEVWTLAPSAQLYLVDERLAFTARWIHAQDDAGAKADGYLLRADVVATDRLRVFAGYADAPEISDGTIVDTRTAFAGVSFDVAPDVTLNASYAHEEREAFDRDTIGLGLAVRF